MKRNKKPLDREQLLEQMRTLACAKVNDAVKLAFLREATAGQVDELELSWLVELKRSEKGVEAKFVDQIKVLEMMRDLMERSDTQAAEEFFRALNETSGAEEG